MMSVVLQILWSDGRQSWIQKSALLKGFNFPLGQNVLESVKTFEFGKEVVIMKPASGQKLDESASKGGYMQK
jgi:hypothetical protein